MLNRFIGAVAFAATFPACAATYYVAPTGSDAAAGTEAAPWQSFAHAQAAAQPGDTVYFRGGRYVYTHATTTCASRRATVAGIVLQLSNHLQGHATIVEADFWPAFLVIGLFSVASVPISGKLPRNAGLELSRGK